MSELPKKDREEAAEKLALRYPAWFFEIYTEFDGKPLILEDFQIRYLVDDSIFKVINKTRQAGGSMMVSLLKMYRAMTTPGYRCDFISINLKESVNAIRYMKAIHDTLPARWKIPMEVDNATMVGFHKGARRSIIHSIAASAGVRGGKKEIVFDEYAHIPLADELYIAATPAIVNGNLTMDIISTPKGNLNQFAKIYNNKQDVDGSYLYEDYSRHQFIWCDVRRFVTNFEEVQDVWYKELKQNMDYMPQLIQAYGNTKLKMIFKGFPLSQFKQEFCGVFLDELTAFFPWDLIQKCLRPPYQQTDEGEEKQFLDPWQRRPEGNVNQLFMGIDFGESSKETDKTSIQILERTPEGVLKHRYSEVLHKDNYPDFPSQAQHIKNVYDRFHPQVVSVDDTGLGRGINPFLQKLVPSMPLDQVNFNYVSKEEMVMNLKLLMERDMIWLQQGDIELQGQIRNIERKLTEIGRATYSGKPHDDMFWALALAARSGGFKPSAMYSIGG